MDCNICLGSGRRTVKVPLYMTDKTTGWPKPQDTTETLHEIPLDWSVVEVTRKDREVSFTMRWKDDEPTARTIEECETWSVFDASRCEVEVAKNGRTTGFTRGSINGGPVLLYLSESDPAESDPSKSNERSREEIAAVYGFTKEKPGKCFGVVAEKGAFMDSGDSGCIAVHYPTGTQLGLCFGVSGTRGLMLPLDVVFRDISVTTGYNVVEPAYKGPEKIDQAAFQ